LATAKAFVRRAAITAALASGLMAATVCVAQAETRSLKLYFVHTGEHATITFKRNGRFDPEGLAKLNRFLRDWRRNEPTKMDPRLFDLIWNVYKKSGSNGYINVLCGYRSPGTNAMLRSRTKGVAEKSQHILGRAMDYYIPGVPLKTLREIGLKMQMGGVGYYPTSGSPFVHMDVGGVRAWPRASREDLVRLFPDGKTIHLPPDGHPLPGYEAALADYKRRMGAEAQDVASIAGMPKHRNLFQMLFGGGGDEDEQPDEIVADEAPAAKQPVTPKADIQLASAQIPKQTYVENLPGVGASSQAGAQAGSQAEAKAGSPVPAQLINAPLPAVRPSLKDMPPSLETALVSPARDSASDAMASVMTPGDKNASDGQDQQYADLQKFAIPVPQLLSGRSAPGDAQVDNQADNLAYVAVPVPNMRPDLGNTVPDLQVASAEPPAAISPAAAAMALAVPVSPAPASVAQEPANPVISGPVTAASSAPLNSAPVAQAEEAKPEAQPQSDELAKLLKQMAETGELDKLAPPRPMPVPESRPEMVAALAPAQSQLPEMTQPVVDASDKASAGTKAAAVQPKKGARPEKVEAVAQKPVNGVKAPKLTDKLIARWALAGKRAGTVALPVKPPEYASVSLTQKPKAVYTAGFTTKAVYVDPARFSGSAVNFPSVERFQ
jgi:uncharacterized protein YcbK (DUF882 family)